MLKDLRTPETPVETPAPPQEGPARACSVSGCAGRYLARGYCIKHYYQMKRHGSVRQDGARTPSPWRASPARARRSPAPRAHACGEPDCAESLFAQGLCRLHYIMVRYRDLLT